MKDLILFVLGVIVGFGFGIIAYWLPLGQSINEFKALFNLLKKYSKINIKQGARLNHSSNSGFSRNNNKKQFVVFHDEGVSWHFTDKGWIRARVLQIYDESVDNSPLFKICHLDIDNN